MVEHWKAFGPPVYMSVASYLGIAKGRPKPKTVQNTSHPVTGQPVSTGGSAEEIARYGNLEELAAMFGETGGVIQ